MSRFIRSSSGVSGGVDLSNCAINTSCSITTSSITTSSCFIGSAKNLCNGRWDVICAYSPCSPGYFGTSISITVPTHCYDEFNLIVSNFCSVCSNSYILLSNCDCACLSANRTIYCCLSLTYSSNVFGFYICANPTVSVMCIPVVPDVPATGSTACPGMNSFDFYLKKVPYGSGVCFSYCRNAYECCCFHNMYRQGVVDGCSCANLAWNANCNCSCRFTNVFICNACGLCYDSSFCFLLFGLNKSITE